MWIPRFAINSETNDIKYVKDVSETDESWIIPEIFAYRQKETAPDFLLTGIWIEKDLDEDFENQMAQMNQEESVYGFIKNTMAIPSDQQTQDAIQKYIEQTYENSQNPIGDISNSNRIILRTIRQNNQTPMKATGLYNEETERVEINVTYTQFGINKVLCDNKEIEFQIQNQNRTAVVTIEGKFIEKGKHTITIIDNENNKKDIEIYKSTIYAFLYSDGTLTFSTTENPEPDRELLVEPYGDIGDDVYTRISEIPWVDEREHITTVEFKEIIRPKSTAFWFYGCSKLTTIKNLNNLNTVKVTSMYGMFGGCGNLTSLDVSKLNTSNVTNMSNMFFNCSNLTSLNLNGINTSNVTDMSFMFWNCSSLKELNMGYFYNLSKVTNMAYMFGNCAALTTLNLKVFYNTSNVTSMYNMFSGCKSLINLDVSNWDTSSVTDMSHMFSYCDNLASLNLKSFDTSNVTNMRYMFAFNYKLGKIYVSSTMWDTSNADVTDMFLYCGTSSVTKQK